MKNMRGKSIAVQTAGETDGTYVRILHTVPTIPPVDVYINSNLLVSDLSYGEISDYKNVPSGNVIFTVYLAGSKEDLTGIINMNLPAESTFTIAGIGVPNKTGVLQLQDASPPASSKNMSFLRFSNLSSDVPPLNVQFKDGPVLFQNIAYKDSSLYHRINPGDYTLEFVSAASGLKLFPDMNIRLEPGMLYTIYAIGYNTENASRETIIVPDGVNSANSA